MLQIIVLFVVWLSGRTHRKKNKRAFVKRDRVMSRLSIGAKTEIVGSIPFLKTSCVG